MRPHLLAALLLSSATSLHAVPQLARDGYSITPKIVDVSAGDTTITTRFRLVDNEPGSRFVSGRVFITNRGSFPPITLTSVPFSAVDRTQGDARDGHYAVTVIIPQDAEEGDWDFYLQLTPEPEPVDIRIRALQFTTTPAEIAAPTISNFAFEPATVDLSASPARVVASVDVADPDGVLPPVLRLASGSDAREFHPEEIHRTAGDDTAATYRYAVWLPPGLPPGSYDWSVITIDDTGTPGSTGRTPNSLQRVPAGAPSLTVTNPGATELGFASGIGEPPFLDGLTISPTSVDLSAPAREISGSLQFSDDASGFASARLFLSGPGAADHIELQLTAADITAGNALDGTVDFALPLPPTSAQGTWTVGLDIADQAGNTATYGGFAGASLPLGAPEEITLNNALPAPPAPAPFTVTGFRFSTDEINLTDNPADVGFELDITDPGASFRSATLTATPFIDGAPQITVATITPADLASVAGGTLTYTTTLHFPLGAIPGPWPVNLSATGTANSVAANIENITVTSFANIDTTTPTLTSFTTGTPVIDVTGAPTTAVFTLGLSGFASPDIGTLSFSNPAYPSLAVGPVSFTTADRAAGDDNAGTYAITVTFPAGTPTGLWYPYLSLTDQYRLRSTYGGTDPAASPPFPAGVADTVTVTDAGTPPFDAFVANHPALTDISPTGDPDRDNLPNLLELVLGTDPTSPDFPSPVQLSATATKLRLTFPVDRVAVDTNSGAPVTFGGQLSTTLRTSNPLPAKSLSGGLYRLETDITPTAPRFLNLRASQ